MLSLSVMIETHPEFSEQYHETIQRHAKNTLKNEEGCLGFAVHRLPGDANRFFLYECYSSQEVYEAHKKTAHLAEYQKITNAWVKTKEIAVWDTVFYEMKH